MRFIYLAITSIVAVFVVSLLGGCTHQHLRFGALNTSATLTDLSYQQVLDNLAMFVENPGSLPHFALQNTGTVQITDNASIMGVLNFVPGKALTGSLNPGPRSRQLVEAWQLGPVQTPDKLLAMRCLFQIASGKPASECYDCNAVVQPYANKDRCHIPQNFFQCGGFFDIPKKASYVGHHGHTYVWVMPEQVDALSRLSLLILDIATVKSGQPAPGTAPPAKGGRDLSAGGTTAPGRTAAPPSSNPFEGPQRIEGLPGPSGPALTPIVP